MGCGLIDQRGDLFTSSFNGSLVSLDRFFVVFDCLLAELGVVYLLFLQQSQLLLSLLWMTMESFYNRGRTFTVDGD